MSYSKFGKRVFDILISLLVITVFSPLLLVIAVLVWMKLGSLVLFRQTRPGLKGQPFTIYKFRTMNDARDEQGNLLPDTERLIPFGKFFRSTSLDELPEFINVFKGEMSMVGPRPLVMQYLDRYTPEQARRNDVLPGITGWAQINGRNAISWEERFALDVWYVDNVSFWLDIKIMLLTFWAILLRKDISQPGHETIEEFMGSLSKTE